MGVTAAATAGVVVGLGILLIILGATPTERESTVLSTGLWTRWAGQWRTLPQARRWWVVGAIAVGVASAVLSGWAFALVLVPLALIAIPLLLSAPPNREVELLAGLDRWVRLVATSISSGRSIRDAFFATRRQAPPVLQESVGRLCTRLDQRWTTTDALMAMADELDSADADAVVAALVIAAGRGGGGVRATLGALSDNIQDRLRVLREVSAERAKPRAVARQVTVITLVVLGGAVLLNGSYFEPYRTPLGQLIAGTLASAYLTCLLILRRRTIPTMAPRFLKAAS